MLFVPPLLYWQFQSRLLMDRKIKLNENTYFLTVSDNNGDSTIEKSIYDIANDGLVVTIERNDDARVKELAG